MNLRSFVVCPNYHEPDVYYIQLGNVRFPLELKVLEDLIEIVDDFSSKYLECLYDLDQNSDSHLFRYSNHENGFKLFKIDKWLWKILMRFSWRFDYDKGNSSWHIFDGRSDMFNIHSSCDTEKFNAGHHATLYPENVDANLYSSGDQVWVTWVPYRTEKADSPSFNSRDVWSANFTYFWLIQELIPYALYYFSLREGGIRNFLKCKLSSIQSVNQFLYKKFLIKFNSKDYIYDGSLKSRYIEAARIRTNSDLFQVACNLQLFFSIYSKNKFHFHKDDLSKLLESFCICLQNSSSEDWHYIRGNANSNLKCNRC